MELAKHNTSEAAIAKLIIAGDLTSLTAVERVKYYVEMCAHIGLEPIARPFDYLQSKGKLTLYINQAGAAQLRNLHKISLKIVDRSVFEGVYTVVALATSPDGRSEESTGAVSIENLTGENKANAMLKAETKAKRRATLSICGLGWVQDGENPIKAEFFDPPMDVVYPPQLTQSSESQVWKQWKSKEDAIAWAKSETSLSEDDLQEILNNIPADATTGKKAPAFYQRIAELKGF
jgi:hypothetical protein